VSSYEPPDPVNLDIDPERARELAAEVEAQWQALKNDPGPIGDFIRNFRIPSIDEDGTS
jgi:hypothetical protein